MLNKTTIEPIGVLSSPFKQKFSIPRQPRLAPAARGIIKLSDGYNSPDMVRDLETFSHLWLVFGFHENSDKGWQPLVRPPRLGGNKKTGVLATRSTFRPNGLGLSAVKFESVIIKDNMASIEVSGIDLLDGTPIYDVKPYINYSDVIDADCGFAPDAPQLKTVNFSELAVSFLNQHDVPNEFEVLIEQILAQDPRPAYKQQKADDKVYRVELYNFDVHWQVIDDCVLVTNIHPI
ncbi:tRNA (N6-threonylcarbamoyladenosine(37)-N6)-methyltransferase TrmO [Psychrobium sp. nBUS_13]|uniref:tRNA (N6-threonylcarbamoyladenosine(37)-N6)-methyltransferase TrmO n=1 Tax=Psychrobium sp. nBUS_13 TaxID=3395319 RepID=UPI003EB79459